MPMGLLLLYGVPFRIIDPATNGGRSCVVLRDSINVANWHDAIFLFKKGATSGGI